MVSCFIQFHLASCTESEKGRLPGLAVSVSRFELRVWGLSWLRLLPGAQACRAVHVGD